MVSAYIDTCSFFLFHFYETEQFSRGEDAPSLLLSLFLLLFVLFVGVVSIKVKLRSMILVYIVTIFISVLLGAIFITIPNESWFNPFGRGLTIMFTGIALFVGQFIVRSVSLLVFRKMSS